MSASAADPRAAGSGRDATLAVLAASGPAFRRTARRCSLCADDADDAYQRAVEILLTKAPPRPPEDLVAWMQVVTRREALAVRRARERLLGLSTATGDDDPLARLPCQRPGPAQRAEHRERAAAAASRLAMLKPDERLAIGLQALGYSYAEICAMCRWSYTKVNRCLSEGRERLRKAGDGPEA